MRSCWYLEASSSTTPSVFPWFSASMSAEEDGSFPRGVIHNFIPEGSWPFVIQSGLSCYSVLFKTGHGNTNRNPRDLLHSRCIPFPLLWSSSPIFPWECESITPEYTVIPFLAHFLSCMRRWNLSFQFHCIFVVLPSTNHNSSGTKIQSQRNTSSWEQAAKIFSESLGVTVNSIILTFTPQFLECKFWLW